MATVGWYKRELRQTRCPLTQPNAVPTDSFLRSAREREGGRERGRGRDMRESPTLRAATAVGASGGGTLNQLSEATCPSSVRPSSSTEKAQAQRSRSDVRWCGSGMRRCVPAARARGRQRDARSASCMNGGERAAAAAGAAERSQDKDGVPKTAAQVGDTGVPRPPSARRACASPRS